MQHKRKKEKRVINLQDESPFKNRTHKSSSLLRTRGGLCVNNVYGFLMTTNLNCRNLLTKFFNRNQNFSSKLLYKLPCRSPQLTSFPHNSQTAFNFPSGHSLPQTLFSLFFILSHLKTSLKIY
jgi:hypothetical protein